MWSGRTPGRRSAVDGPRAFAFARARGPIVAMPDAIEAEVARLHRTHYRRLIAPLIRVLGSFEAAEDVVQDAFARALVRWREAEIPDDPAAWLYRVARNGALDIVRREQRWRDKAEQLEADEARTFAAARAGEPELDPPTLADDTLRLMFTCCHPSLSREAQIGLTLRTVGGLTSDEIARAFLVPRQTLQQRLVRARRKIDAAKIPYLVPEREELPERLFAVLHTVYLVFTEGYGASAGDSLIRRELCDEAIRLGRLLVEVLPDEPAPVGLLALMLLHHSRRDARTDGDGELVTLDEQDRGRWDRAQIAEALPLVERALSGRPLSTYAVEAAIAALHAQAPTAEDTDWAQITALYDTLLRLSNGNPVVALNRAVARAMAGDLEGGRRALDDLAADGCLDGYHLLPTAQAHLLERQGELGPALAAFRAAHQLAGNEAERRHLERRIHAIEARLAGPD